MPTTLKTLTVTESDRLLDCLRTSEPERTQSGRSQRNYTMAVLMLDAGLRVSEVCHLLIADLLIQGQPVRALCVRSEIAKRQRERTVPLTPRAQQAISECRVKLWDMSSISRMLFAFCGSNVALPITSRQVERITKRAGMAALNQNIHPHILRHTFATRLMRVTNIRVVQELLGHKNLSSTQVYTHPNHEDLQNAIGNM